MAVNRNCIDVNSADAEIKGRIREIISAITQANNNKCLKIPCSSIPVLTPLVPATRRTEDVSTVAKLGTPNTKAKSKDKVPDDVAWLSVVAVVLLG